MEVDMLSRITSPRGKRGLGRLLCLGIIVASLSWGCDGKSTDPENVNFNIYVGASYYADSSAESRRDRLYIFDADSLVLLDSISLSAPSSVMAASPDGQWLYVTGGWGGSPQAVPRAVRKVNAQTHQVDWSDEGKGIWMTLLQGGDILLYGRDVLSTSDATTLGHVDASLSPEHGALHGTKIAAIIGDPNGSETGDSVITIVDVLTGETSGRFVPRPPSGGLFLIYFALLHQDERRVLAIVTGGQSYSWLVIGDLESGETLLQDRLYSPFGQIAISADGSLAVATDPSQPGIGGTPRGVNVVDLDAMQSLKRFDNPSGLPGRATGQACFLPGGRKLVTAPLPGMFAGGGPFCIIDLTTMTVTDTTYPVQSGWGGALGAGVRP
jgi:hypothetical protein